MTAKTLTTGQRIALARKEAGWTQRRLAAETGIHQPTIARAEKGGACSSETLDKIMTVLRNAGATVVLDSVDGVLGIQGRTGGKLIPVADLMAPATPKDWLVSGFIARRFTTIIAGQGGSGKSMLTQTLAVALANGDSEAFGFRLPGKPLRGLMLDVENVVAITEDDIESGLVNERLQAYGLTTETQGNLTVVACLEFDLDKDSDSLDVILSDAKNNGTAYDFVILDSFRSLAPSTNESTPEAGRVIGKLNRLAAKYDVAVILLHHTNKAGADYSGHTSIESAVSGALWTFSKLVHKNKQTGKKEGHPTLRYLNPAKVRIAASMAGRIVSTSGDGIVSTKSAEDYEGYVINDTDDEEETV